MTKNISSKSIGQFGEIKVQQALLEQGYKISNKNLRTPYGEIDIIATKGSELLICEVKCQMSVTKRKQGFELLGYRQRQRLTRAAKWIWLKERNNSIKIKAQLWVVTRCETKVCNLPLLYDDS